MEIWFTPVQLPREHLCVNALTSHDADEEVELRHSVAEGGRDESRPCQTTAEDDDWSTAKSVHKDAADGAWREKRRVRTYRRITC